MKKILNFGKILAIGAHPDDVEFGCLGFLLKHRDAEIFVYVASLGSIGDPMTGPQRKLESLNALSCLSAKQIVFREKSGVVHNDFEEILGELRVLIESHDPDLILTLGPHDTHQEHRLIHQITVAAARRLNATVLNYGIISNTPQFSPSIFVDISDQFNQKREALVYHKSQARKYYMTNDYLEIFHSDKYACLHGVRYCEAYEVVRMFV
jgi:LmbE family N-acetylglucosaminyl deacetylase